LRPLNLEGELCDPLVAGWHLASSPPSHWTKPSEIDAHAVWHEAHVPGTVAAALSAAGVWDRDRPTPLDDQDHWYRIALAGQGLRRLRFNGLATIAEVFFDDEPILQSDNMFLAHEIDVQLAGRHELAICFRALAPRLAAKHPRARWRPRIAKPASLRHYRTTLLGYALGWSPPIHCIGPWRSIEMITPGPLRINNVDIRTRLEGTTGILDIILAVEGQTFTKTSAPASITCAGAQAALERRADGSLATRLEIADVQAWWPHTYGTPALHDLDANIDGLQVDFGRIGFRRIEVDRGRDGKGFGLVINGVPIFCRGACWTNADLLTMSDRSETYAPLIARMVEANMNMVRVGGTMVYEGDAFYRLCDEQGLLVWQDFMFANFDYPAADPDFIASVKEEARQFLQRTQASPSLAVLCGGSEVAQQAAMFGLPAATWSNVMFDEVLPKAAATLRPDLPYVPNTPCGGELPFVAHEGISHYYGVSAHMRPLEDARRAEVRFAAECLGFANVPERGGAELEPDTPTFVHPPFGERIPGDTGATWYFDTVRNHYLEALYGLEPAALRRDDPALFCDLSRATSAEVMEATFAEWRRHGSITRGGLVWCLRDLWPCPGFGILDSSGEPKAAYFGLQRAMRPLNVILTDEGLNGLQVHLVNEHAYSRTVVLSLVCLRDGEIQVMRAARDITLAARSTSALSATELWGGFFDTTYAFRFGEPSHDVTCAFLADPADGAILAEAFHFPLGRKFTRRDLGLAARLTQDSQGWSLCLSTQRFAQSVHIDDENFRPAMNWLHIAPGVERRIALLPRGTIHDDKMPKGSIAAVNGERIAY
jgi:beta-mannosidase